ncbi:MAG: hypothetical protein ACRDT0_15320 [Pseudonocardiaceae bacterium]
MVDPANEIVFPGVVEHPTDHFSEFAGSGVEVALDAWITQAGTEFPMDRAEELEGHAGGLVTTELNVQIDEFTDAGPQGVDVAGIETDT